MRRRIVVPGAPFGFENVRRPNSLSHGCAVPASSKRELFDRVGKTKQKADSAQVPITGAPLRGGLALKRRFQHALYADVDGNLALLNDFAAFR